ncbi:hypothetical protein [Rhodopirellula europaea]|uniref:hypothetical protein n=1 Tax=Rhodopirellula europaea TaxID=1263866 RepID=UPI003D2699A5
MPNEVDRGSQGQQNKHANELINGAKDKVEPALRIVSNSAESIKSEQAAAGKSDCDHETRDPKSEAPAGEPNQQIRCSDQAGNNQNKD